MMYNVIYSEREEQLDNIVNDIFHKLKNKPNVINIFIEKDCSFLYDRERAFLS